MNITAMVTFDSRSGTGKKGGKASTARRKGGRNAKQPEVTTIIDRPSYSNADNTTSNGHQLQWTTVPTASQIRSPQILPPSMAYPEPSRVTSFQTVPSTVASDKLSQMQSPQTHPIPVAFGGPSTATSSRRVRVLRRAVRAVHLAPPMTSLFLIYSDSRSYVLHSRYRRCLFICSFSVYFSLLRL